MNSTDVHKVSGHLLVCLACFEDCNNTPLLLPTGFLEVQTEPTLTKCLLSLVVQLALQCHMFLIRAEQIPQDSNSALRRL